MSPTPLERHREVNTSREAVEEVSREVEHRGVEFIYYQIVSVTGRVIGKVVPAKHLSRNLDKGVNLHRTAICDLMGDRNGGDLFGGGAYAAEFTAMPDIDTFQVLPWDTSVGRFLCQVYEPDHLPEVGGEHLATDSRGNLKRAHAQFQARTGLRMKTGCEPEMTWSGPGTQVRFALGSSPAYHIENLELMRPVYQKVIRYAQAMGLDMIEADYEDPGQVEMNWMFDDADLTADRLITYRSICKQVARELGLEASFMPKPSTGQMGNGCHHNLSLWDGDVNVLEEPNRRELHLTDVGLNALGGILSHAAGSMLIMGPTVNSYKRYWDSGQFAPSQINWGMDNKTCTVRLSANGRLEYKLPDASVNPYLSHAALLAAIEDGLNNKIDPGEPTAGSSYDGGIEMFEPLPLTLVEAVRAFEKDDVVRASMPGPLADLLLDLKRDEWARFCAFVTDWEHERYWQAIP
ncbi:MAG: glutamine synthetase [Actinobacteria bacterium]|jgi:glutamine synthetase|nr:glutamine synthetase [Actinomycetota bacterium]MCO5298663.1 glutamine synthetase family protein [Candidatus Nanopelagicales bacterium]HPE13229.1 glutamine synthetase family protein [Actinomycetota bacterium]HPJ19094.1 glutamine synthetase family protein [Actinomycetota bacterium]HPQ85358.1 glutamine synthetase family protein [Actinomycetota bacterium]